MTPQQMQDKIKNLEVRVALLERELGKVTGCQMQAVIAALQSDVAELMRELGDTRERVLRLEEAATAERLKRGRRPGRFQSLTAHAGDMKPWREHE